MTITDRNAPAEPQQRPGLTQQQRTLIAAGGLLVCLLVGAGIVYWLLFGSSPKRKTVQVDPAKQGPAAREIRVPQRRDVPGIYQAGDEWVIRAQQGEMRVGKGAARAADPRFRFLQLKLAPEQVTLLAARVRILSDEAMAAEWKVTPDQKARLTALQVGQSLMNPSSSQREELWRLWTAFDKASGAQAKMEAQKKLLEKLDEVTKNLIEPTRQQFAQRLDEMKRILTAEQIQVITKG